MTDSADRASDRALRERELALQERELDIKATDLELKRRQDAGAGWRSPIVVAVLAAAVAAAGNAVVTVVGGVQERRLAAQEAEHARILEMIKTGDPDTAASNLQFLLDAGLVGTPETVAGLRSFLAQRAPGTGPTLAAPFLGGIVGADDAAPVAQAAAHLGDLARSVGYLAVVGPGRMVSNCTAFLVGESRIATAGPCVADAASATFLLYPDGPDAEPRPHEVDISSRQLFLPEIEGGYALLDLVALVGPAVAPLRLSDRAPEEGSRLGVVYFRGGPPQLAIWNNAECIAVAVTADALEHSCDTGLGTSGSPVFDVATRTVAAIHFRRSDSGGIAHRLDRETHRLRAPEQ